MRTKRFLSLLLAIAMLAAMTISASAAETSKIYLTDDFPESVYTNGNTLLAAAGLGTFDDAGKFTFKGFDIDGDPETDDKVKNDFRINGNGPYWTKTSTYANTSAVSPDRLREVGATYYMTNWNASGWWTYGTNSLGHNALHTKIGTSFWGNKTFLHRILPERWEAEADEALVFSVEIEPIQTTHTISGTSVSPGDDVYKLHASTVVDGVATNIKTTGLGLGMTKTTTVVDEEAGTKETSWVMKIGGVEVPQSACNRVYNYSTVLKYVDAENLSRQNYVDGVELGSAANVVANAVEGYNFMADQTWSYKASKAKVYTLSTAAGAFNVARTGSGLVNKNTVSMPVKFSQPVEAATYDADAVTITGVRGDDEITLVNGRDFDVSNVTEVIDDTEIYSTAVITFNEELEEATDYTITFPGTVKNTAAVELEGYNTISFSTPTPDIVIDSFNIVKGWGSDAETTVDAFAADGTLQVASLELRNTTEAAKNVAVIYAVYGSNGQLTDVVYANDTVAGATGTVIGAGMNLTAVGSVKAFVWDGISSLKPHSEATVKTIADPAAAPAAN